MRKIEGHTAMTEAHDKTQARQGQGAAGRQPAARSAIPGVKTLLSVASVVATVGGWALLAQGAPPATTAATNISAVSAADALNLPPVPTVVPVPDLGPGQTSVAPRAPSLRSVAAPAPVQREVRAPITITRSSR
jgi:hypothetical protein